MEEKKNYAKIALFGLRNELRGFATAVHNVKTDDMADKETRAFWQGARYSADACIRACRDAENWAKMSEEYDNDEAGDAEVEAND